MSYLGVATRVVPHLACSFLATSAIALETSDQKQLSYRTDSSAFQSFLCEGSTEITRPPHPKVYSSRPVDHPQEFRQQHLHLWSGRGAV